MKAKHIRTAISVATAWALVCSSLAAVPADNQYIRDLADMRCVTFEDGCRAIMMLRTGDIPEGTFADIFEELAAEGIVKQKWHSDTAKLLDKGRIAYLVCKTLGIKGGLTTRLFGMSERYALRALVDKKIMVKGEPVKYVSGGELLGIIFRAQKVKEERASKAAAKKEAAAEE